MTEKIRTIRVVPRDDDIVRKHLKHPAAGGFREGEDSAMWPLDSFTRRRLNDGDITTDDET